MARSGKNFSILICLLLVLAKKPSEEDSLIMPSNQALDTTVRH
jgi:hypothetical protein